MNDKIQEIPDNHPIGKIWELNSSRVNDLARIGDRDAVRTMLVRFRAEIHSHMNPNHGDHPTRNHYLIGPNEVVVKKYLYDYFSECMGKILNGEDPRLVFGWTDGTGGRRELTGREKQDRCHLAYEVHRRREADSMRGSLKRAILSVAQECKGTHGETFTIDQIRDAYREYFPSGGKTN